MNTLRLSLRNLQDRPLSTLLSVLLLVLGVGLISLVLHLQHHVEQQMKHNLGGIDLVVGAKGSPLQLILSSVLHIDNPTGNISLAETEKISRNPFVKKAIPLSYGDNYKGFRIVGTEKSYPELYSAEIEQGTWWAQPMEVTLGATVAMRMGLKPGDHFHGNHGLDEHGHGHEEHAYQVVGVLKPSHSVLDQLILTATESVWEVHNSAHEHVHEEENDSADTEHQEITALLIQFRNPMGAMQLPRIINETTQMQAALPAFEINRLFSLLGFGIETLQWLALIILIVSGLSVFISLFTALNDRQYEMAFMRTYGASKGKLFRMVLQEGWLLALAGFILGFFASRLGLWIISGLMESNYHYAITDWKPLLEEAWLLGITLLIGTFAALIPAIRVLRMDISKILSKS